MNRPNSASLKKRWNELHEQFPEEIPPKLSQLLLRTRRAITWLERAEQTTEEDLSVRFIVLWIGFNAAYARDPGEQPDKAWEEFRNYFEILNGCDKNRRIHSAIWERFSQEIRVLLDNKYVSRHFWDFHHQIIHADQSDQKQKSEQRRIKRNMQKSDAPKILSDIFDRLYVLRNQLMHGGATCNSELGRDQTRDGAAIMDWLLPVFIDLMLDNHEKDWGTPFYPRVEAKPIGSL